MSIRNSISQIPSKVKETTVDAWTLFTSLMNPDNPQAKERIITWAFGSMSARDLIHVIQTKQDIVVDTEARINESTFNRRVASGIINAQWNNMTAALMFSAENLPFRARTIAASVSVCPTFLWFGPYCRPALSRSLLTPLSSTPIIFATLTCPRLLGINSPTANGYFCVPFETNCFR